MTTIQLNVRKRLLTCCSCNVSSKLCPSYLIPNVSCREIRPVNAWTFYHLSSATLFTAMNIQIYAQHFIALPPTRMRVFSSCSVFTVQYKLISDPRLHWAKTFPVSTFFAMKRFIADESVRRAFTCAVLPLENGGISGAESQVCDTPFNCRATRVTYSHMELTIPTERTLLTCDSVFYK